MEVVSYLLGKKSGGGGGGVDEYFKTELTSNTSSGAKLPGLLVKKIPSTPITVASNVTSLAYAFQGYEEDTIPNITVNGNITSTSNMFAGCVNIKTTPLFNTSSATNTSAMFAGCSNLETIPLYNTGNATDMRNMFMNCTNLKEIPQLDFSKNTNMYFMFAGCIRLQSIPDLNTINATNMSYVLYHDIARGNYCDLESIGEIDCTKVQNISNVIMAWFNNQTHDSAFKNLTTLGGFKDLGKNYLTTASQNYGNYTLDLSVCFNLTHDSLMNVINKLYDIGNAGVKTQKLVLGEYNLAKLSADEIAIATNKGWVVS